MENLVFILDILYFLKTLGFVDLAQNQFMQIVKTVQKILAKLPAKIV